MAIIKTKVQQDLTSMVHVTPLKGLFFGGDVEGNMLGVYVTNKGQPVELEGNCRGYVILSDNSSFMVNGEIEDSTAWITLPAACYSKTGVISIAIKVGTVTLAAFCGVVHKTLTETIIDPDHVIPSIDELIEKIAQMEAVMEGAENVNAEVTKTGNVITISVTNKDGVTHEYDISEMDPDEYARKDGYYSEMTVGNAEQLVSSKFVEDQEPYTLRASGGSADIGNRENLTAIVGGTLAWNQQVRDEASDNVTEFADIVTVDDAVADNAGVKVKLESAQDLHGYDSPWPAGGGKNLFGGEYGTKWILPTPLSISAGDQLAISASVPASGNSRINIYTGENGATRYFNAGLNDTVNGRKVRIATFAEDITITAFLMDVAECTDIQIEEGSTATAYAPYSNICPISGFDSVKVTRTGKNLLGGDAFADKILELCPNAVKDTANKTIFYSAREVTDKTIFNSFKPNTQYTFIFREDASSDNRNMRIIYTNGSAQSLGSDVTVSIPNLDIERLAGVWATGGSVLKYDECGIFEGSLTIDQFAPYSGQTYSITFPSEAGTVYGGELTVNEDGTGTLVVDRVYLNARNVRRWYSAGNKNVYTDLPLSPTEPTTILCSHCDYHRRPAAGTIENWVDWGGNPNSNGNLIVTMKGITDSVDTWNEYIQANDVEFVYFLATPLTYTLTASQVTTLLGTNNVWADAGQVSLTYTGTDEHLTLTDGRKYLTRINGTDSMVLGAGQAVTAVKGRDNVFDLTQMFGTAAVADYVYGQGAGYFRKWFPNSVYAYNPGELKSVEGLQSHDTVGFNLWDEEWETGSIDKTSGEKVSSQASTRSKNYIPVFPNSSYYVYCDYIRGMSGRSLAIYCYDANKTYLGSGSAKSANNAAFTTPDNCHYILFRTGGNEYPTTYQNDICIHLVNSGSRNGEYEPYEKHSYPLDSTLTLRGIPKAGANGVYWDGDQYKPDGTVERRYGVVDLGSLNWTYNSNWGGGGAFYCNVPPAGIKTDNPTAIIPNALCTWYEIYSRDYLNAHPNISGLCIPNNNAQISIRDSAYADAAAFKSAMSGVLLVYELATPTTETAEPYKELQQVDDWGTEEFVTTGLVPVGHTTQYPANLRDKLQHLPDLASSNGIYIVKQTDSEMELMRLPDMPTANGNYRLKLNVASGSPTFSWEVVT